MFRFFHNPALSTSPIPCRVKEADISLCVLSLPDTLVPSGESGLERTWTIQLPEATRELVSSNTYFILNKADLVDAKVNLGKLCINDPSSPPPLLPSPFLANRAWILSLSEQKGTTSFLEGFGTKLHQLYSSSSGAEGQGIQNAQAPIITRARHRVHLESACAFIQAFLECRMFTLFYFYFATG